MVLVLSLLLMARSHELVEAVKRGQTDIVRVLLAVGGDPDAPDDTGIYPLDYAAFDNKVDLARLLLEYNAQVNLLFRGSTPLDLAVAAGHAETARLLIDNGADVRRVYPSGRTPLHIAAAGGSAELTALLIDRGAEIEARDRYGLSPLDLAISRGQAAPLGVLLDSGAKTQPGLLRSALRANRPEVVRALVTHTKVSLAEIVKYAIAQRRPEILDILIQAGADLNARDEAGFTALQDAALSGNLDSVRILVDHGADVNAGDKATGATPLYMAATMGREQVVSLLLEKGADPNRGPNPTAAAAAAGFDKVADLIRSKTKAK